MATRTGKRIVALSVSLCISEMVRKHINADQIDWVEAGTACRTPTDWDEVISDYRQSYWDKFPDKAERIIRHFLEHNMVSQPRLEGKDHPIWQGKWRIGDSHYHDLPANWQEL